MSEITTLTQSQPQIAQLECLFKGPLEKGSMVEFESDLILLDKTYHYNHKRVWVKEFNSNFYLANGDGSEPSNWKKESARVVIKRYELTDAYQIAECVYQNGKIYTAKVNVPNGYSPADYENYWLCIAGETETYRYLFFNASSVIVYTEIRNPKFEVILGDVVYDENNAIVLDEISGLAKLINKEIVDAPVVQREDLPNNNGVPYEISFYEDDELSIQLSGCINIK